MDHTKISQKEKNNENDKGCTPVTVLGLGPMGQSLAEAFLKYGHPTTVWNRTAEKAESLVKQGAVLANTVADAITASSLIVICVLDYDASQAILTQVVNDLKGRTLVNLTTSSPEKARKTAIWASEHGFDYLDGAIQTPPLAIGTSDALILYSGGEYAYNKHQKTLKSLGGTATYLGTDPGRAAAYDISLLDMFWTSISGYVHALAVAKSENIAAKDFAKYAQELIKTFPYIMTHFADDVDTGQYPGGQSNMISAKAGMEHIIHTVQGHGIDASVLSAIKAIAQKAIDEGYGTDGYSRLVEVVNRA
ncbi:NAD(P)-dependent oxidoreductase [Shimazuella alba]|uniref:NAD(P)-binding domain-containing protein n=1 Tax=Shimazuella alba TaxID=2690964 RepID=A0A6I4VV27_9BACL|nr:NAD(P)-binding domain-containing protein [Shimazuella alba]MXQ54035.1 NAD(P)-binding domain-containing protein [Shimazuella alba]